MSAALFLLLIPQAPPLEPTYVEARADAIARKLPLVVFVGVARRNIAGAVTVEVERLDGYAVPCVVVGTPVGDSVYWRATLPSEATDGQIQEAIAPRAALSRVVQSMPSVNC